MLELLTALAVAATVFLFFLAIAGREDTMRTRLDLLRGGAGKGSRQDENQKLTLGQRTVQPVLQALVNLAQRLLPRATLDRIERRLIIAGEPMTLNSFMTMWIVCAGTFGLMPVLLVAAGMVDMGPVALLLIAGGLVVGIFLPQVWLSQRVGQRKHQIIKSLPDSFDLITTCVEAGLGLDAALTRVSEKVEGAFSDELRRALHDMALGKARRDAMKELGERTGVPDLISFVHAVNQAEQMGSSLGAVLRVQSEQLRVRRRQRAEEQAYKAPVKMLFPLILCIFPTLFIVILGPAAITIVRDFPG